MNAAGSKNSVARDAGCSELCILHLLGSFAIIALQHNSWPTLAAQVSPLHYPPCLFTSATEYTHKWKETARVPKGYCSNSRTHART